jgi:hypothetical protein
MSRQTFQETIAYQKEAGTLFNTYTTAKTVIPQTSLVKLPTNYLDLGRVLRTRVWGALSNIVTTPGTVTFQIMLGSIVVWTSGPIQLNATAHTLLPFWLDIIWRVSVVGTSTTAKIIGGGILQGIHFTLTAAQVDAVNTAGAFGVPATAPANGTGFDSTIENILDFWVGFSINDAGNGVQVQNYLVESLV